MVKNISLWRSLLFHFCTATTIFLKRYFGKTKNKKKSKSESKSHRAAQGFRKVRENRLTKRYRFPGLRWRRRGREARRRRGRGNLCRAFEGIRSRFEGNRLVNRKMPCLAPPTPARPSMSITFCAMIDSDGWDMRCGVQRNRWSIIIAVLAYSYISVWSAARQCVL